MMIIFTPFGFQESYIYLNLPTSQLNVKGKKKAEKRSIMLKGGIKQNGMDIY